MPPFLGLKVTCPVSSIRGQGAQNPSSNKDMLHKRQTNFINSGKTRRFVVSLSIQVGMRHVILKWNKCSRSRHKKKKKKYTQRRATQRTKTHSSISNRTVNSHARQMNKIQTPYHHVALHLRRFNQVLLLHCVTFNLRNAA